MRYVNAFLSGVGFALFAVHAVALSILITSKTFDLTGEKGLAILAGAASAGGLLSLLREAWK